MRSILGMVKVQLTMGTPCMTSFTTQSPKSSARRCAHEGQRQFVLHENARNIVWPQDLQRILAKPLRKSPQSVNLKNLSCMTGRPPQGAGRSRTVAHTFHHSTSQRRRNSPPQADTAVNPPGCGDGKTLRCTLPYLLPGRTTWHSTR